jgi:hypothetical protein
MDGVLQKVDRHQSRMTIRERRELAAILAKIPLADAKERVRRCQNVSSNCMFN